METVVRFFALLLTAWALTNSPASAADQQDFDTCRKANADLAIAACTRVIDDQRLPAEVRAAALLLRSLTREDRDHSGAMADLDEALRVYPNDGGVYKARARLYQKAGDDERALADLNAAIR